MFSLSSAFFVIKILADLVRSINDPEHPLTLEELNVLEYRNIQVLSTFSKTYFQIRGQKWLIRGDSRNIFFISLLKTYVVGTH